jgi:hypothetical protein
MTPNPAVQGTLDKAALYAPWVNGSDLISNPNQTFDQSAAGTLVTGKAVLVTL